MEDGGDGKGKRRIQLFCPSVSKKVQISARDEQKLDLGSIARAFGLDPNTLKLNGHFISRGVDLISSSVTWKSLIGFFSARGLSTGATDSDAVVVGGKLCKIGPKSTMFSKVMYNKKGVESCQKINSVSKPPREPATAPSKSPPRDKIPRTELAVVKRPASDVGGPSKKKTKSRSSREALLPPPVPTLNRTHFHSSITKNTEPEVALQFIQGCCPLGDRDDFDKEDDLDLLNKWALDQSKAYARLGAITARACHGFIKPETALELEQLRKQNEKYSERIARYQEAVRQLEEDKVALKVEAKKAGKAKEELEVDVARMTKELEQVQQDCTKRIDEARAEGEKAGFNNFVKSEAGLSLLQRVRAETKRIYIRSEEFCYLLSDAVRFYYDLGLDAMGQWLTGKGFTSAADFDRESVICNAPDAPGLNMNEEDSRINNLGIEAFMAHVMFASAEPVQPTLDQTEDTIGGMT